MRFCLNTILIILSLSSSLFADSFKIINDPQEALSARYSLISHAKSKIFTSKFIFRDDDSGLLYMGLLREKAREIKRRGEVPNIKLIIDTAVKTISTGHILHLEKEGIEIKFYNDLTNLPLVAQNFRKKNWNFFTQRMHDKLVITDSEHLISGGRNIENSYFGLPGKHDYMDRDVYMFGEVARQAEQHFLSMWENSALTKPLKNMGFFQSAVTCRDFWWNATVPVPGSSKVPDTQKCLERLEKKAQSEIDERLKRFKLSGNNEGLDRNFLVKAAGYKKNYQVDFLSDELTEDGVYISRVARKLEQLTLEANQAVYIESPYLIPTKSVMRVFEKLLNRGVRVTILTNSLMSTDGVTAYAGYYKYRKKLMDLGPISNKLKIYEYMGGKLGRSLHSKSIVVDDCYAIIGSYNLDPRSDELNTEVMFVARSQEKARELRQVIRKNLRSALRVGLNGFPCRLGECRFADSFGNLNGGSEKHPYATPSKKLQVDILWRQAVRLDFFEGQL